MPDRKRSITVLIILAVVALLSLTGADCALSINTGSSSSDKEEESTSSNIGIANGALVDAPVEGVQYESGAVRGLTGPAGEFSYESGGLVRFHIGDIPLGNAVPGKALMTPLDLVAGGGSLESTAVINIGRLLQSLDAVAGDDRITIPAQVRERALASNPALTGIIEYLQYADETRFVNAASHLLAVLTEGYPHTAVLVDAAAAQSHMRKSFARAGVQLDN